jgi:hypothetical protein
MITPFQHGIAPARGGQPRHDGGLLHAFDAFSGEIWASPKARPYRIHERVSAADNEKGFAY